MISEPFAVGDSLLHRTDPAAKIISAMALALSIATTSSFQVAGAGLLVAACCCLMAGLPVRPLARRLAAVNIFTLLLWVTLPLTGGGEQVVRLGSLQLSGKGIVLAGLITLKANAVYLLLTGLLATSSIAAIGHALKRLRLPDKLTILLLTTYRYLGRIELEYKRLRRAAVLRCFHGTTNLHSYRTYGYLIGMTLIRSYERSRRIHQAMIMRGFKGTFPLLIRQRTGPGDIFFLALCVCISLLFSFLTIR